MSVNRLSSTTTGRRSATSPSPGRGATGGRPPRNGRFSAERCPGSGHQGGDWATVRGEVAEVCRTVPKGRVGHQRPIVPTTLARHRSHPVVAETVGYAARSPCRREGRDGRDAGRQEALDPEFHEELRYVLCTRVGVCDLRWNQRKVTSRVCVLWLENREVPDANSHGGWFSFTRRRPTRVGSP